MRFTSLVFKKTRQAATPRKLKSAERRLLKEREKYPLLVDWIAEQQPTAQEKGQLPSLIVSPNGFTI
jgi:hypothetical protein